MDAVEIETLPANKPLLNTKLSVTTDKTSDENDVFSVDEIDEDDELRLRLSDEDDNEQDKTSGQVDNQQANLQTKNNGLESDEDLTVRSEDSLKVGDIKLIVEQEESLSEENIDEKLINENSVDDQDLKMSGSERVPPLHNSPKYWNNFDKRWKGQNQSRNRHFSHRSANDWYNQQYPDKFNNKHNNFNNHFNRRSSSRLSYNNSPTRDWDKDVKKEEKSEPVKTNKNSCTLDEKVVKDHSIKENGIPNDVETKENKSSIQKEKSIIEKVEVAEKQIKSSETQSEMALDEKCVENGINNSNDDSNLDKIDSIEDEEKVADSESKSNDTVSATENCDLSMTEVNDTQCESKVDKLDESDSSNKENLIENCTENLSNDTESKQSSDTEEVELNVSDVASQSDAPKDICENSMDISDENEILDETVENHDVNEIEHEKDLPEIEESKEKESSSTDTNSGSNEDSNHSVQEKVVLDMEVEFSGDKKTSEEVDVESKSTKKSEIGNKEENRSNTSEDNSTNHQKEMKEEIKENAEKVKEINMIEEVDLIDDDVAADKQQDINKAPTLENDTTQNISIDAFDSEKMKESNEDGRAVVYKRRRRKRADLSVPESTVHNDTENGGRQKRRSARNAEEMIRKEILKDDEDDNSSDDPEKLVKVNYKKLSLPSRASSPPSLKRTLDDVDQISETVTLKKVKPNSASGSIAVNKESFKESRTEQPNEVIKEVTKERSKTEIRQLVRKISQEDIRGKLKKLSQEDMEALLLQKIVECITMRGEMGKLREQARTSKRNQEACRAKCQQLQKQVEGFDMVLKRINYDKTTNNDKYLPPIKINRSVGLQVNFMSQDNTIQNLKQIQAMKAQANAARNVPASQNNGPENHSPRKTLKTRSPRRPEVPPSTNLQITQISTSQSAQVNSLPNKTIDSKRTNVTLPNTGNIVQIVPPGQAGQTVVVNSSTGTSTVTGRTVTIQRTSNGGNTAAGNRTSDLIDLTDEEDKSKSPAVTPITTQAISSRFPRVLQAVPASVALSNAQNLRIVQTGAQGSQTAIVNNVNGSRVAYVMQGGVNGVPRQLVLTNNPLRPVTTVGTRNISTISYKTALANGQTVRVVTAQGNNANAQFMRHPAPLPETPQSESNALWKLPPPAPSLKISKVATGIVLSWNMEMSTKYAEIVSYQLYAYQEVTGTSPSAALWKKIGDVRALPLPMACTLTQFLEGNNYYFAVRAVDIHSRLGQYSKPGNISL